MALTKITNSAIADDIGLGGNPTTSTQTAGDSTTRIATTAFVSTAVANLVDSAPATLNTLAELATAIGSNATLSSTLTSSIATKLPLAGGTLTGDLILGDSIKLELGAGTGGDLQLYHDGSHSYVTNTYASGALKLVSDDFRIENASNRNQLKTGVSGAVQLFFDDGSATGLRLGTTAAGVDVTGNIAVSGTVNASGTVFFNTELRANNVSNKLIIKADSSATELHASGSTGIIFKNSGNGNIASFDASAHFKITNDLQMGSTNPRIDYDNNQSTGSFRLFSTSRNAASHQFYPNGHAHFITTAGTFKIEGLGSTSNQIESGGSLKIRSVSGHVDLLDGTTEVLQTTTTGVTLPLNLVVNGKLGINENSLSSNARLQVRYDNSQSYNAYNALTNPSMIIKNSTAGADKFTTLGFFTESNGEGAISLVQGSGNINADMTFSVRSSGTRAEHMRITHDGKVGIGTSAPPHQKLTVTGVSAAVDGVLSNGILALTTGTGAITDTRLLFGIVDDNYAWLQAADYGVAYRNVVIIQTVATLVSEQASPNDGKLQVYGNSSSDWAGYFYNQNANGIGLHVETDSYGTEQLLRLSSLTGSGGSNTVRMVVRADGNVGIGTSSPDAKLRIDQDVGTVGLKVTGGSGGTNLAEFVRDIGANATIAINASGAEPQMYFTSTGNTFSMGVNGSTFEIADNQYIGTNSRFSITNAGNVGIGTASPFSLDGNAAPGLTVSSNGPYILLQDANNSDKVRYISNNTGAFQFGIVGDNGISGKTEHMRIASGGNVGIGDDNPDNKLVVKNGNIKLKSNADGNTGILMLYDAAGAQSGQVYPSAGDLRIWSPNDVLILPTGNVGIGDNSPVAKLSIKGANDTNFEIQPDISSGVNRITNFNRVTSAYKVLRVDASEQQFYISGNPMLKIFSSVVASEIDVSIKNGKKLEFQTTAGSARGFISAQETNTGGTHPAGLILATSNGEAISFKDNNIGGTTNMIITGAGSVGIGTPNPAERLHVEGSVLIDAFNLGDEEGIFFREGFSSTNKYNVSIMAKDHNGSSSDGISINGYDGISFCTGSNDRNEVMRIIGGSSGVGNVGIGTQSPAFTAVSGSTNQIGLEIQNANNDSSAHLKLTGRNNTGTPGQATSFEIAHRGDSLVTSFIHGGTEVWRFDSSGHAHLGMNDSDTRLTLGSLGTPNTNSSNNIRSVGTILRNNAGGSTGTHEWEINGALKLQIQSSGVLQTTTTGSGDGYDIIARSTDGGDTGLELTRNGTVGFGIAVRAAATDYADFQVNDGGSPSYGETGKMRLYADGSVSIPGTALWSSSVGHVFGNTGSHYMIRTSNSTGNESMIITNTIGSGGALGVLQYRNGGSVRGDYLIANNTDGIYFNSASDYRFKENVTTITDSYLTKLTSLRPVTYTHSADMDEDTSTVHTGFIAHEVEEIFPEFVEGDKDAVYTQEDLDAKGDPETTTESAGDPLYQSVAYSKKEWNVYIVKALQELKAENEALKARIEVLEG